MVVKPCVNCGARLFRTEPIYTFRSTDKEFVPGFAIQQRIKVGECEVCACCGLEVGKDPDKVSHLLDNSV